MWHLTNPLHLQLQTRAFYGRQIILYSTAVLRTEDSGHDIPFEDIKGSTMQCPRVIKLFKSLLIETVSSISLKNCTLCSTRTRRTNILFAPALSPF